MSAVLRRGPVPLRRLIELAAQIADGLQAAHDAPVVHRVIKPDNILLTRDGRPKIVDFGLARPGGGTSPEDATQTELTGSGVIMGTTAYMSPEQARGERVDFRSDQFSFGIVLYEMAAGSRPFDRASPRTPATATARRGTSFTISRTCANGATGLLRRRLRPPNHRRPPSEAGSGISSRPRLPSVPFRMAGRQPRAGSRVPFPAADY